MTCYHPAKANYAIGELTKKGKQRVVLLKKTEQHLPYLFTLPCGQCIGCRLEYSRQWAVRIHHEGQLHEQKCFITLTYNNENLPSDHSLKKKTFKTSLKDIGTLSVIEKSIQLQKGLIPFTGKKLDTSNQVNMVNLPQKTITLLVHTITQLYSDTISTIKNTSRKRMVLSCTLLITLVIYGVWEIAALEKLISYLLRTLLATL